MRPDPVAGSIGDPQSFNRFAYSKQDPVNLVDPIGLDYQVCDNTYVVTTIIRPNGESIVKSRLLFSFCTIVRTGIGYVSGQIRDIQRGGGPSYENEWRKSKKAFDECIAKGSGQITRDYENIVRDLNMGFQGAAAKIQNDSFYTLRQLEMGLLGTIAGGALTRGTPQGAALGGFGGNAVGIYWNAAEKKERIALLFWQLQRGRHAQLARFLSRAEGLIKKCEKETGHRANRDDNGRIDTPAIVPVPNIAFPIP